MLEPACGDQTNEFELIDVSNCFVKFPWTVKDSIPDQVSGDILNITWDNHDTIDFVNLELWYEPFSSLGALVGVIAENHANTGTYSWTVGTFNRGTDSGYRLKIANSQNSRCADRSVRFHITDDEGCSIDVLGINGGQVYAEGEIIPIIFNMQNSSGVVDLKLFSGNIQVDSPPANGIISEGLDTQGGSATFNWTVSALDHPGPAFHRFNIRAFDVEDEYCVGKSLEFTIAP